MGPNGGTISGGSSGPVIRTGPNGGTVVGGGQGGSYTGPNGGTVSGGRGGAVAVGPNGGVGAVGGKGGSITGPGGNTVGGARTGGGAIGPGGGTVVGGSRGGVVGTPGDGGLAAVSRGAAAKGPRGTVAVSSKTLATQGATVRRSFVHYNCFGPNWWPRYPNAWRAAAWTTAAAVWATTTWNTCASYCDVAAEPVYYDYGTTVIYESDQVYVGGEAVATQEQYAQQATDLASAGQEAKTSEKDEWLSLGVFALVQGSETDANNLFQLAVNKEGIIRGNYYNGLSDSTLPVQGSVDKKTQRAAWTVGDKKDVVYEAGLANLTRGETPLLVHFGKERTQQWTLIHMEQPPQDN